MSEVIYLFLFITIFNFSCKQGDEPFEIYERNINDVDEPFLEIMDKYEYKIYNDDIRINKNEIKSEFPVFNLFNVVDTLDNLKNVVYNDLYLKKGVYVFSITNLGSESFLFVSDSSYTFTTGFCSKIGEVSYRLFNLEKQLKKFMDNNPGFIKDSAQKDQVINRLKFGKFIEITSMR